MVKLQDAYVLGLILHKELIANKIHYAKNEAEFDRIWTEAMAKVETLVKDKNVDLLDPHLVREQIDFVFYSPHNNVLRRK